MKNPKILIDSELLLQLKNLVQDERKITLEILHFLREVERRRLYASRAYSSLHEMCVKELGYSSGAAWRRIESMRLLREVPEVEEKILSGELNLSVLSQVQTYVKQERKDGKEVTNKAELLQSFCGRSVREVQKELVALSPKLAPKFREKVRPLSPSETELKIIADPELTALLEEVRNLSGIPGETLATLLKKLARTYIAVKTAPAQRRDAAGRREKRKAVSALKTRFVPKATKILVRSRAENRCEHKDALTNRRCEAKSALQFDHRIPFASGGTNEPENLQLLCAAHNTLKAIQEYGPDKMSRYLPCR